DEDKRLGYLTQAVAPLTATDRLAVPTTDMPSIVDGARRNPYTGTQFHVLRHADPTSTATGAAHISLDLAARATYTYDDVDPALAYAGTWRHAGATQTFTGGDAGRTESFSTVAGDSVTVAF